MLKLIIIGSVLLLLANLLFVYSLIVMGSRMDDFYEATEHLREQESFEEF